jgi:LacI family gluconate utilization system Gnt-I transcriptional repressor
VNGISVPDQLALSGFSGLELLDGLPMKVATTNAARYEIGMMAAKMIVAAKAGDLPPADRVVRMQARIDVGDTL